MKFQLLRVLRRTAGSLYRAARKFVFLCLFPVSYFAALVYSAIQGRQLRICEIQADNLGGWVRDLDAYLRRRSAAIEAKFTDFFLVNPGRITNSFVFELTARQVAVVTNIGARLLLSPLASIPNRFQIADYRKLLYGTGSPIPPRIKWFSDADHAAGDRLMRKLGMIPGESWYACFFARDEAYNDKKSPAHQRAAYREYHACRNSDIDTYTKAIEYVISKGGYAVRMGSVVKSRVNYRHPRFIDYPFSDCQSDFADIYLTCHCKYYIGNGSGLMATADITAVPVALVNYYMYELMEKPAEVFLFIPKLLKYRDSGAYLSLEECFYLLDSDKLSTMVTLAQAMLESGLMFEDNSADDIAMITAAMHRRFVEKSVSDEQWSAWRIGSASALKLNKYCQIWEPFLDRHPFLLDSQSRETGR